MKTPPPWKSGDIIFNKVTKKTAHYKGEWRAGWFVDDNGKDLGYSEWVTVLPCDDDGKCLEEVWDVAVCEWRGNYGRLHVVN